MLYMYLITCFMQSGRVPGHVVLNCSGGTVVLRLMMIIKIMMTKVTEITWCAQCLARSSSRIKKIYRGQVSVSTFMITNTVFKSL